MWLVQGTAGWLQGDVAYLNWIDDLLNVDPAHTTSQPPIFQPAIFLTSFQWPDEGWGFSDSTGLGGGRGTAWALEGLRTALSPQDGSPIATMAITCGNPEVSVTVI